MACVYSFFISLVNILTPRNKQQSPEMIFFQKPANPPTQTLGATPHVSAIPHKHWVQGLDLNQGPSGYEPVSLIFYKFLYVFIYLYLSVFHALICFMKMDVNGYILNKKVAIGLQWKG